MTLDGTAPALVTIEGVSKTYGAVRALSDVSFSIRSGVVHGLVGANGAGKSTLIKCLAGIEQPDGGVISIDGAPVQIAKPSDADALGLAFIHQEMSMIPGWSVLRNLLLGRHLPKRLGLIDWRPARARATVVADRLGYRFGLDANVDTLSTADKWLVLIGRALMDDARLIAMDEPTASLSATEADRLHGIIRDLTATGTAVVFVSHRLDEVSALCDDVTVFKDGAVTRRAVGEPMTKPQLISAIVGRDLELAERGRDITSPATGTPVLDVRDVSDGGLVKDASLRVHAGEVVGLAGLVGAGRSELAGTVYGSRPRASGEVLLDGVPVAFREPADAVARGIGLVPEERRSQGLFLDRSIDFNINVASVATLRASRWWPLLRLREARKRAIEIAGRMTVKARDVSQPVGSLSGGNQQKVAIARWLVERPRLLILDEPSRGVDVGARAEIHRIVRRLAEEGTAILAISSDNEELVGLCDRVVIMAEGRVTGELVGREITIDGILELSFASTDAVSHTAAPVTTAADHREDQNT
jgi:ABC-type sugar transport system ATPase subunit